jgi:hypothetical protein
MRPPGEDSLVSVKEASQKDNKGKVYSNQYCKWLQKFLAGLHPRHDAEGSCEAPVHIHR